MLLFVSHPEVVVDPAIDVPRWHLKDSAIARLRAFAARLSEPGRIVASTETKAIEAAGVIAARFGRAVSVDADLNEIDRGSTGFVAHARHEALADTFFARPDASAEGWENALDAQARIVAAWRRLAARTTEGTTLLVGHGGTGTLLMCALGGLDIARRHDQPGQGCAWAFDPAAQRLMFRWTRLEEVGDPRITHIARIAQPTSSFGA